MIKQITFCCLFIILCICTTILFTACSPKPDIAMPTESVQIDASDNIDFSFVVIGKTSAYDVYDVIPSVYAIKEIPGGLLFEYLKQDGRYIHITFQGKKLIASAIEEVSESIKSKETEKRYYTENDFQSIIVGKSTVWDVYEVAPDASFYAASYGSFCELPMEDGRYIQIKFHGSNMTVGSIEVVEESLLN